MQQTVGALAALVVLLAIIVGPIFLAVSAPSGSAAGLERCTPGTIGCDVSSARLSTD
jgi:hypothetical protein